MLRYRGMKNQKSHLFTVKKDTTTELVNTKHIVAYTRLQWSKDYYTKDLTVYMLGFDIIITTRQLTVVTLSDDWEKGQELIWKLHMEGMENKEISNYLNSRNIKPRRTKIFSGKLIWSLLERYRTRKKKKEELDIRLENICFDKRIK